MAVLLETSLGDIVIDLYTEERPRCSLNFLKLCKIKYYNFCLFHSVQRDFIAQSGDPTGTGDGGQSVWASCKGEDYRFFEAEVSPAIKHKKLGAVSMVENGSGLHTSQFFVTLREGLSYLDGKHTVFGEVTEGMDVLQKINEAYCDKEGRPFQDIRIYHTVVLDDPFPDPEGLVVPERSPSPPKLVTDSSRIGAEEDVDEFKGKTEEEVREMMEQREANANAQILEMVGDIPDADAKPPENVLFICKLNPATTAEDLEIIFSRFGPIITSEVIKDHKTGDSLQYAFIEFENEEDCVNAYFKMDNVLIDDRRIHVDFCQSLAKVKGIRQRKQSSEDLDSASHEDRFVARQKPKDDNYEMVFDTVGLESSKGKKRKQRWDVAGDGASERREGDRRERDKREDRHKKDRKEGREERNRAGEERGRERERERERERDRKERRGREKEKGGREEKHRHRSRSRSRERGRHHKHRNRSRSRERH